MSTEPRFAAEIETPEAHSSQLKAHGSDATHLLFLRNVVTSWVVRVVMLGATFVVTPFVVHGLGKTLYGLWAVGFTLMGYFTLLDVGVNGGLVSVIAAAKARGEEERVPGLVATALAFYTAVGIVLLGAVFLGAGWLSTLFGVPHGLLPVARGLFVGVTVYLVLVNLTGVFAAVLNGLEAIHIASFLNLATAIANAIALVIVVTVLHGQIPTLMVASVAVAGGTLIATWLWARRLCPSLRLHPRQVRWLNLKGVMGLSLVIQLSNVAGVVNASIDKLIVAGLIGLSSAGLYDLGSRLTILIWTMSWLVASSAFPTTSRLAEEASAHVRAFYVRAERYLVITLLGLGGMMFVVAPWLVGFWLGPGYDRVALVTRLLAVATAGVCMSHVARVTMWSLKRSAEVLKFELWRGIMHIGLSTLLVWRIGFNGGLIGAMISLTLPSAWLVWIVHRRLEVGNLDWLRSTLLPPVAACLIAGVSTWVLVGLLLAPAAGDGTRWPSLGLLVLGTTLFCAIYASALARFRAFEGEDLAAFRIGRERLWRAVRRAPAVVR